MDAAFDLNRTDLRRSLAETIAWCECQQLIAHAEEPEDTRKRRALIKRANELRGQAHLRYRKIWNRLLRRDYRKSREWQLAEELSREAHPETLRPPLSHQLRTPFLAPSISIGANRFTNDQRKNAVDTVVQKRSELLRSQSEVAHVDVGTGHAKGRMLVYSPDENVEDGASEVASCGFFDLYDAPPWDVWVAYSDFTLLAWVPPQLSGLAQAGIDFNPVGCIRWLD